MIFSGERRKQQEVSMIPKTYFRLRVLINYQLRLTIAAIYIHEDGIFNLADYIVWTEARLGDRGWI